MKFNLTTPEAVASERVDLYTQVEQQVDQSRVYAAANQASLFLKQLNEKSALEQENACEKLGISTLRNTDVANGDELALSLVCVSLIEVTREHPRTTATERVTLAMENLSQRYQADW